MAVVLRAYQERAATLVQAQWRGLQGRKAMFEQLERGVCAPSPSPVPAPRCFRPPWLRPAPRY